MQVKIFIFLLLMRFSNSQVTFPETKAETTEMFTEESPEFPEEETEETFPTEEPPVTEETIPVTTQPAASANVTICAAFNQCGIPSTDLSGKMDVRVNNQGKAYDTVVGTNDQITNPVSPGVTVIVNSQQDCPMKNTTEICTLTSGYKCGIAYKPIKGMPTKEFAADYVAYPWQGLVMRNDPIDNFTYYSSGVLISHKHFMTVANKVVQFVDKPNMIRVRLGDWNLAGSVKPFPPMDFLITDIVIHSYYDNKTLANNLAMLYFATYAPLGQFPHIGTACLPQDDISYHGIYCMVAGYGKMSKMSDMNFVLKDVDQPLHDPDVCQTKLRESILGKGYIFDPSTWLCAGGEVNKSNCDGDGGNPLVCNITGQWYVVGLASWAPNDQNCGANPLPELYVNIAPHVAWIQYVTEGLGRARRYSSTKIASTTRRLGKTTVPTSPPTKPSSTSTTTSTVTTTTQRKKIGITTTTFKLAGSTTPEFDARNAAQTRSKVGGATKPSNNSTGVKKNIKATKPSATNKSTANKKPSTPRKPTTTTTKPKAG